MSYNYFLSRVSSGIFFPTIANKSGKIILRKVFSQEKIEIATTVTESELRDFVCGLHSDINVNHSHSHTNYELWLKNDLFWSLWKEVRNIHKIWKRVEYSWHLGVVLQPNFSILAHCLFLFYMWFTCIVIWLAEILCLPFQSFIRWWWASYSSPRSFGRMCHQAPCGQRGRTSGATP